MTKTLAASVFAAAIGLVFLAPVTRAQVSKQPSATDKVRISGWALNMSNTATGANQTIQITIDGWSNPSQRQHLIDTFMEKKQDGLRARTGEAAGTGPLQLPGLHGSRPEQHHASRHRHPLRDEPPGGDGGRRIVIITPRVIGFQEARNQPRTVDYPFTLFEMRFDKDGKGEGRMAYATQIAFDKKKNTVELENYSSEPVRLNQLKLEVRK